MQVKVTPPKLSKLIERENAIRYMMISLFSFVATVSIVRAFLALTGYPQIGTGTLHIAHVLWGGLILYIAAILPLIYLNPRLHTFGAILSGVGVGLFIDEVGKFITRQNDYFFPAAAPIIYVFFLLVVILVVMIRRPEEVDGRAELVQALEIVREQLYRPLETEEKSHLEQDMTRVIESDPDVFHQNMATRLLELVHSDQRSAEPKSPSRTVRIVDNINAWLTEARLRWILIIGMIILCAITLKNPLQVWLKDILPDSTLLAFLQAHAGKELAAVDSPVLYNVRLGIEVMIGVLLILSIILFLIGRKRWANNLALFSLLVSLAILDMLLFYFEQFSTVLVVLLQFILLFGVLHYRNLYIKRSH